MIPECEHCGAPLGALAAKCEFCGAPVPMSKDRRRLRATMHEALQSVGCARLIWQHHESKGISLDEARSELAESYDAIGLGGEWEEAMLLPPNREEMSRQVEFLKRRDEELASQRVSKRGCFPAGSCIWTAAGQVPIELLREGDFIVSWSHFLRNTILRPVTRTFRCLSSTVEIHVSDSPMRMRTTLHHTVRTQRGWLRVRQLRVGDELMAMRWGMEEPAGLTINGLTISSTVEEVFNLYTAHEHNFFAAGFLVHSFTELRWLRALWYGIWTDRLGRFRPAPAVKPSNEK